MSSKQNSGQKTKITMKDRQVLENISLVAKEHNQLFFQITFKIKNKLQYPLSILNCQLCLSSMFLLWGHHHGFCIQLLLMADIMVLASSKGFDVSITEAPAKCMPTIMPLWKTFNFARLLKHLMNVSERLVSSLSWPQRGRILLQVELLYCKCES